MEKMYLNTKDVCQFLDISISKLYKMTSQNEIPVYRFGGKLKFKKEELIKFVESGVIHKNEDLTFSRIEELRVPSLEA
jgi:excisionase family DNA binding protein